jgi:hypothetical protein
MRDGRYLHCCMGVRFICSNPCSNLKLENINRGVTWPSVHFQFKLDPSLGSFSPFTPFTLILLRPPFSWNISHPPTSPFKFYDPDTYEYCAPVLSRCRVLFWRLIEYESPTLCWGRTW